MARRITGDPFVPEAPRDMLAYEMWMLRKTQEQIAKWDAARYKTENGGKNAHVYHAVIESFLVHTRNLFDFYFLENFDPNEDVTFRDVLPHGVRWSAPSPRHVRAWRRDINKTVQHMSRSRGVPQINWDELKIRQYFDSVLEQLNRLGPLGGPILVDHPDRIRRARATVVHGG